MLSASTSASASLAANKLPPEKKAQQISYRQKKKAPQGAFFVF
ncbi:hypothetical protein LTSEHVI_5427 [Salmonella enterica subsp. enterica serovar Hvittingfoss str. A4-620]|nr:hypothetical protein LTSEHVI_5427 [Salmonella enterica subsp. enterica serovar Hvittingfoss str. A4-620]